NCLAGTPSVPKNKRFNFRKDEFAFKGDTDAVQKKFLFLGLCFLMIVTSWIFATVARYSVTSTQAELAKQRLEDETFKVLGQKTVSRTIIEKKLMPKTVKKSPVPVKDSFDIIFELSKRVPQRVIHDVEQLQIKPGHIKIVGLVNSELSPGAAGDNTEEDELSPTDLIKSKLSEFDECFTSFKIPRVRTINDRQEYTMEIDSKCP
ncbi:MAG: hypothetical protein JXR91_04720, partial [Deltaproteobacteria bacterium]|nr:hypothetical protein [Deltaproteobacteria bacterium]